MSANTASLVEYNPSQIEAINHKGPPLLIVAGAGSGKTATLVGRVTKLVREGVKPNRILMLTFTNKAAKSMLARSDKSLGDYQSPFSEPLSITAGTFHSIAYQLLHKFGVPAGFFRSQYVLGEYQTKRLWEKVYYGIPAEHRKIIYGFRMGGTNELATWNSQYTTSQLPLSDFLNSEPLAKQWDTISPGLLNSCFAKYREYKNDLGGIDFDDILVLTEKMLREPQILKVVKPNFEHILVDEYQDTSLLQASMLKSLAGDGNNLVVVGDPKQSIYHFLAARVTNITRFTETYPNAQEVNLLENYRSNAAILSMANHILEGSKEVDNLHLKATKELGLKPHIHKYGSERMEARGILRDIKAALARGIKPSEIAVLSRISSITFHLERELVENEMSYVKVGGLKLMNKLNIRQFIAFLEITLNKYNWLAWETILPMIPLIGKELTGKLLEDFQNVKEWDWDNPPPVSLGSGKRWLTFQKFWEIVRKVKDIKELELQTALESTFTIFEELYAMYWVYATDDEKAGKSGMEEEEDEVAFGESMNHMEDRLNEIRSYIVEMTYHRTDYLANFLDKFKLDDSINQIQAEEKITLSTIHSAKGLEWDFVTVTGLEEGTLPIGPRSYGEPRANTDAIPAEAIIPWRRQPYIEEEKRLFYVACTRARKELHVTFSAQRRSQGRKDSPFIKTFKPKGQASGTTETELCLFTLEKMSTEEEKSNFSDKYKRAE